MISVVLASFNRRLLLERTLAALEEQRLSDGVFEVVVADNGSTDDTAAMLRRAAEARRLDLRVLTITEPGKSVALNAAVQQARGDLLALIDDDVLTEPGWLQALSDAFRDPGVDFVAGRILPLWESPPPAWLSPPLYGVLAVPDGGPARLPIDGVHAAVMPIGANMAVRRRVVERLGGWRTDLGKLRGTLRTGEDHEFFLRMLRAGCRGLYEPGARVRHLVPADRLRRAYFREWFHGNGRVVALLEREFPTAERYLLGVPRYLWGAAARDLASLVKAAFTGDAAARFACAVRLRWFAGYLRQCWGDAFRPAPRLSMPSVSSS